MSTGGVNPARSGVPYPVALLTRLLLYVRGARVGRDVRISISCRVFAAKSISIGDESEILRNSTIDGCPRECGSVKIGHKCRLKENVWIASYEGAIEIGDRVLIGRNSVIHGHGGVNLGDDTMLGPGCMIFSSDHLVLPGRVFQDLGHVNLPTQIGGNVWLGAGVIVTGGSTIDDDVVVAAGSVVHGHLSSGMVYGGSPAKALKKLSDIEARDPDVIRRWEM
jgi:acetyltransferase-like isoleucine patch superfamily enzyme